MGNRELLWSQCMEIGLNHELIWATPRYFIFLQWHQCSSRLLRDFSGHSVVPSSKPRLLTCLIGTRNCSTCNAGESLLISQRVASLMVFLEFRREHGVCSRVMVGVAIKNFCLFIDVRTPFYFRCTPQESKLCLAGQYVRIWRRSRRPRFTS